MDTYSKQRSIYLDYNATTPVDAQVFEKIKPYFCEQYGNPASSSHKWGWQADSALSQARKNVALLLSTDPKSIIFTSGATESNNWAILMTVDSLVSKNNSNNKVHIITSSAEHKSVLACFEYFKNGPAWKDSVEVDILPVNKYGQVEIKTLMDSIKPNTQFMSFMWANNETGSRNPIKEISRIGLMHNILFHCDITQGVAKDQVDCSLFDFASFSGHKIYAPKGIGALYCKNPKNLNGFIIGGSQEFGLRAGTVNVPGAVGLGESCLIATQLLHSETPRQQKLIELLKSKLSSHPLIKFNSDPDNSICNTLSITFTDTSFILMMDQLTHLGFSSSAACSSGSIKPSSTLLACGLSPVEAKSTIRISIGKQTSEEDINLASESILKALNNLSTSKPKNLES